MSPLFIDMHPRMLDFVVRRGPKASLLPFGDPVFVHSLTF